MTALVEVPFHGDKLQAVRDGVDVHVVVRRVCEALGIDANGQQQRLRDPERAPWATTCVTHAVAEDGKVREVFAIHLDCLPMWLATIDASRVRPEARQKLIAYQRECARVLRDHFFGERATAPVAPRLMGPEEAVVYRSEAAVRIAMMAAQYLDPYVIRRVTETAIERVGQFQLPAPENPTIDVEGYLSEKGLSADVIRRKRAQFGKRLAKMYRQERGAEPPVTIRFINGADRRAKLYHETDRELFDMVFSEMFAGASHG